jgi:hypothetical protein
MADCNFLSKAISIVQQATEKDAAKEYAEAFRLYQLSLEYFMTALKCKFLCVFGVYFACIIFDNIHFLQMKRTKSRSRRFVQK